jgi:integrase
VLDVFTSSVKFRVPHPWPVQIPLRPLPPRRVPHHGTTVRKRTVVRTERLDDGGLFVANGHLKLVAPAIEKRTVTPKRAKNSELRTREYLTEHEVEALMAAARQNRRGHRNATMILIAFRHGLRASELVDLRWDQVDFQRAVLHVRRAKQGTPSVHPLTGLEMRALRRLQRESGASTFVLVSERGAPFTTAGFARMMERAATVANLKMKVHPHMLRHACGFALANAGHDTRALQAYLGHRNIQHTVRYTELAPDRFKHFWKD